MEPELDLRPYIVAVLRRWRLIILCMFVLIAVGVALALLTQQGRSASADVLIVPSTSQITLDTRFQTINGNQASTPAAQRLALINLASSPIIAEKVAKELGGAAQEGDHSQIDALLAQIEISSNSDLLQITVTDPDPARALQIAQAWGQAYEGLVADVYTRSQSRSDLLDTEITLAQQRYDETQKTLETLLSDRQLTETKSQIDKLSDLLDSSRQAQLLLYTDYLSRTRELDLILEDAQTLRDQAEARGTSGFADSFATLLLRARTVDSAAPTFQLSAGDFASGEGAAGSTITDLDQLIAVLSRRHDQLIAQANELAGAIASSNVTSAGLDAATQQRYTEQLATLSSTYEKLNSQQTLLTQQRDLARDTLLLLQRKRDEQEVGRSAPQIEVRFVSANLNSKPSILSSSIPYGAAAGVLGLVFGVMLVLLLDIIIPMLRKLTGPEAAQATARSTTPSDRPLPGD